MHQPWLMGVQKQKINRLCLGTDYVLRCKLLEAPSTRPQDSKRERNRAVRDKFQTRHMFQDMLE